MAVWPMLAIFSSMFILQLSARTDVSWYPLGRRRSREHMRKVQGTFDNGYARLRI